MTRHLIDPKFAAYAAVGDPAALERDGLFVAEGRLVVERLLEDGRFEMHSVAVTPAAAASLADALARHPDVPVLVCEPAMLHTITGFNFHRGCLALARRPRGEVTLADLSRARRVLALEGVTDPDNVGGLFRTAFAFGLDAVVLDRASVDPLYRKAIRTSMAATLRLPFLRMDPWIDGLTSLRARGFQIVALTPAPDALALEDFAPRAAERFVLVVGSEGFGMGSESLALADVKVRIPVDPRADSLNVVTAAAIALYSLSRH